MKIVRFIICFFLAAVLFGACLSPWTGEEKGKGNLSISWGKSSASRIGFAQESELPGLRYRVILTGPGGRQEYTYTGVPSASFTVLPGAWTVTVKGYEYEGGTAGGGSTTEPHEMLRVMGIEQVEVKIGKNGAKKINMYTASEVNYWYDLEYRVSDGDKYIEIEEDGVSREEIIVIKESFNFEYGYPTLSIYRPITLIAENNVTIGRDGNPVEPFSPFFFVEAGGTLTLGKPGMAGTLTIDNGGEDSYSLVEVIGSSDNGPATLIMNDGVTICGANAPDCFGGGIYIGNGDGGEGVFIMNGGLISGNKSDNGGGLFVNGDSVFTMNGGSISGNSALSELGASGGGVYLELKAVFTMNGGTISGNVVYTEQFPTFGGGVFVGGTFTMNGGVINNNVVSSNYPSFGGGVFVTRSGEFSHNGGVISNNDPDDVYVED